MRLLCFESDFQKILNMYKDILFEKYKDILYEVK
jgi:hypothetical protein